MHGEGTFQPILTNLPAPICPMGLIKVQLLVNAQRESVRNREVLYMWVTEIFSPPITQLNTSELVPLPEMTSF